MTKRGSITEAMRDAGGGRRGSPGPAAPAPATAAEEEEAPARKPTQASRVGMRAITVHFPPEVRRQLRVLAAEQDRTMEDVVGEALNLLFAAYGKAEIAPTRARHPEEPEGRR